MSIVGAKWWKFDFHTHTPASSDYGKGDPSLRSKTARDWLLDFIDKGIECIAVTDHNSGDWIDNLKVEAEKLRAEGNSVFIFPGVEITANSNIHILGILDPSATSAEINGIIGASGFYGKRGESDAVTELSAEGVIKKIQQAGGIAIPAHIDMPSGLCQQHSSITIKQVCKIANAVEIIFPKAENPKSPLSRYTNLKINLPSVIGSDSHKPTEVGRAFTWVKMSNPSIEGLKLALIDGSSSITRSDSNTKDPNTSSSTLLHSVKIENSKYIGHVHPFTIEFNPWLNSIIGGRGSGKSSIIEFIRLGMDRARDLEALKDENEIKKSFDSFSKISTTRDSDGVMSEQTKVSCIYKKDEVDYQLVWDKKNERVTIFRKDNKEWVQEDGEAHSRFPIKIFSQKQIFNLAKNPSTLLNLIDESPNVSIQKWNMEWQEKKSNFKKLCSLKEELQAKLQNKNILLGDLQDIEQKILAIEKSGHEGILKTYKKYKDKKETIDQHITKLEKLKLQIENTCDTNLISEVELYQFDQSSKSEAHITNKLKTINQIAESFKLKVKLTTQEFQEEIEKFKAQYAESEFITQHDKSIKEHNELIEKLKQEGVQDPKNYAELLTSKNQTLESINQINLTQNEIEGLEPQINNAYQDIIDCRKKLTLSRLEFLKENLSENKSIKITLTPFADSDYLEESFRKAIGRPGDTYASEIYDEDKGTGFLYDLNKKLASKNETNNPQIIDQSLSEIDHFKNSILNFKDGKVQNTKIGKKFADAINNLKPEMRGDIKKWFPRDKITIKFHDGMRFKDVSQGSAGQKASAILSFLLSYGTEPLILDQPEDDLDNGLITNLIVSKLQESKSTRQIIVVTHNPNIVVNGDSEYVIALEDRGQTQSIASGALQEANVRNSVCEIMEGGQIALQQRYRRMFNI